MVDKEAILAIKCLIDEQRASMLSKNPFYRELPRRLRSADFAWCANLYHLSCEFTDILRIRHERFHDVADDFFLNHYREEVGHAEMLQQWMLAIGLDDPRSFNPTFETEEFVSILQRAAVSFDRNTSLLIINSTAEGFAFDLYTQCYSHLVRHGFPGLSYWEIHSTCDSEHCDIYGILSAMTAQELSRARHYVAYTLDIIDRMIRSWSNYVVRATLLGDAASCTVDPQSITGSSY